ncbi:MAG: carbamoyltransferase HypF [Chloroflexia bacterium]
MCERRRIRVQGIVQGVGFRPFVYGLAARHALGGYILNDSAGVTIEVEGEAASVEAFVRSVHDDPPPLALVERVAWERIPPNGDTAFVIEQSRGTAEKRALISPDVCACDDCLRELFDPADRRYRYPFTNCTNCGPRFTIIRDVPYDRSQTTMDVFPMCEDCRREYDDPLNRRFHAQPNACPRCGPQVSLMRPGAGEPTTADAAIREAQRLLSDGAILAVKGLGGYHLACDALNGEAVARLRARKHREGKPFALMAPDPAAVEEFCLISEDERAWLTGRRRPIVLLRRREPNAIPEEVAPGQSCLGFMLPYTPLHYLLTDRVLVMTSGNISDEPIAYRDDDAFERLGGIADAFLTHNRAIHMRCDDSVVRGAGRSLFFMRRSRGYAPQPIGTAFEFPVPTLAVGSHLKNTFCLGKGRQAFVSNHIGDLENLETLTSFREGIEHFGRLFDISPEAVAYDLHPDYLATKYALDLDVPYKIGVQHHHAHIAGVLAEHGLTGPVIGVAADGTGYGTDGAVWGCEIMAADLRGFERLAHLAYVPLPGGEQAVRQPWRMGAVYLVQAYGDAFLDLDIPFVRRLDRARWRTLAQMAARGINSPQASSLGRLFDAVAALLGVRDEVLYEGQAAIELEAMAEPSDRAYPFAVVEGNPATLDVAPLIRAIVEELRRGTALPEIAGRFHRTVAEMLSVVCGRAREETGLGRVALSGGVFQNRLLLEQLMTRLEETGFQVYLNRQVPPNDGGLSLGQAAVAAAIMKEAATCV